MTWVDVLQVVWLGILTVYVRALWAKRNHRHNPVRFR